MSAQQFYTEQRSQLQSSESQRPMTARQPGSVFEQQVLGMLDQLFDADEEFDRLHSVHDAVIVTQSDVHHRTAYDLAAQ